MLPLNPDSPRILTVGCAVLNTHRLQRPSTNLCPSLLSSTCVGPKGNHPEDTKRQGSRLRWRDDHSESGDLFSAGRPLNKSVPFLIQLGNDAHYKNLGDIVFGKWVILIFY